MEEGALLVVRCAAGAAFEEARVRVPLEATVAELKKRLMAQRGQAAAAPSEQKLIWKGAVCGDDRQVRDFVGEACEGLEGSACFHLVQSSAAGEAQAEEGEQSGAEADGRLRQEDTSEPPPTPGTADVDAHTPPRTPHTPSPYSPQPATPAASHAHALATDPVYAAAYFAALGALSITASAQPWRSPTPPPTHTQHVLLFVPRPPAGARGERHAGVGAGGYLAAAAHARAQARRADWSLLWLLLKLLVAVWVVNQDGSRRSCAFFTALAVGVFLAQAGALQPLLRALQRKAAAAEAAAAGLGPGQRAAAGLGRRSLPQEAGLLLYGLLASLLPGWAPPGAQHQAAAE